MKRASSPALPLLAATLLLFNAASATTLAIPDEAEEGKTSVRSNSFLLGALSNLIPLPVVGAPSNLSATSASGTSINLSWAASSGAVSYRIERSPSLSQSFTTIGTSNSTSFSDTPPTGVNSYLYRVRALDGFGAPSASSNIALGTAITFTDSTIIPGVTVIKGQHLRELRQAVNAVRRAAGLFEATWTDSTPEGVVIKAVHLQELRDRLDEALTALSIPLNAYTDPTLNTGATGTLVKRVHFEELRERSTRGSSSSSDPGGSESLSSTARLDPLNQTGGGGENPLSRNFNWRLSLVGLEGRAGLDLGLSLSYNSLVWTKHGSAISFDDDHGFPSPGFHLGFPVLQPAFYNAESGKYAFILITPDGSRTELLQVGSSNLYQATDSSYLTLDSSTLTLRATDGTQLSYAWEGSDYECVQIKDRNGNYLTATYTQSGQINTIVDTLGRTIKFNYTDNYLTSITQDWTLDGQPLAHTWASFDYSSPDLTIQTNFTGLSVLGPQNGTTLKVLTRVTLSDQSHYDFDYTSWGQIWKMRNYAPDGHLLSYRSYNLPGSALLSTSPQTDCPRFTERHDWVENWNRGGSAGAAGLPTGAEQEAVTTYAVPSAASWTLPGGTSRTGTLAQVTMPDQSFQKIYFAGEAGTSSGWQRGLPSLVNTYDRDGALQRQAVTLWTQDDESVSYQLNPRAFETHIYDPSGNHKRTRIAYQAVSFDGMSCNLPQDVFEYREDAATVLRRTHTEYNLASTYTSRHLIGLVSEQTLYEVDPNTSAETLMSKVGFAYDESGSIQGTDAPLRHDNVNYSSSFVAGRGNLSSVKRYDVSNSGQFRVSSSKFNTAGAVVASTDPLNHQVTISYADSFSEASKNSLNTLAYPTAVTDPDGFTSSSKFNYDFGAATWTQTPLPNVTQNQPGPEQTVTYDNLGRLARVTNVTNGAYIRYEYAQSRTRVDLYVTIQENMGEAHSFGIMDGLGRVIATASDHPGSEGGFSGQLMLFDAQGRVTKVSNPTETTASGNPTQWPASGADAQGGWVYTQQAYDWKGRPTITTNPDNSTSEISYGGCGCAGGVVTLVKDEVGRWQRITSDILGRTRKVEILNTDAQHSVYSTVVNTYNARDQITNIKRYQGTETSNTYQEHTMTFDGYGQLLTSHAPEQRGQNDEPLSTSYSFNEDGSIHTSTDARGAVTTYGYNNRQQVTSITYTPPSGGATTSPVTFTYDAAGNRISMADGSGSVSYSYDQLSRLTSETRNFTNLGSFTLSYGYNLAGEPTSITDPWSIQVGYSYDKTGKLTDVTGSGYAGVTSYASNMQYRAWGALKAMTYGNSRSLSASYNSRLQPTHFEVTGVISADYQYNADGSVHYLHDLLDSKFDRSYTYDHAGRLIQARTGAEARGLSVADGPYSQDYQFDAWGNMNGRDGRRWDEPMNGYSATYVNNRRTDWTYDGDGRPTQQDTLQTSYDAAGRRIREYDSAQRTRFNPGLTLTQDYDGDGQKVKQTENTRPAVYYLRSSVLDGEVIAEITQVSGVWQRQRGYVYADGEMLAKQEGGAVQWMHHAPVTGSQRRTNSTGAVVTGLGSELDPLGVNAGLQPPPEEGFNTPLSESEVTLPKYADMLNGSTGCTMDEAMGEEPKNELVAI